MLIFRDLKFQKNNIEKKYLLKKRNLFLITQTIRYL